MTMGDLKHSVAHVELWNNLVLLCKYHYGRDNADAAGMLRLFQEWTGTDHSTMKNAFAAYIDLYIDSPLFTSGNSKYRNGKLFCDIAYGTELWVAAEKDTMVRALQALRDRICHATKLEIYPDSDFPTTVDLKIWSLLNPNEAYSGSVERCLAPLDQVAEEELAKQYTE
jgi:hypothetical protein